MSELEKEHEQKFPTRIEFLAKAETLEMCCQPVRALKKQCRTYHVISELIISLLQLGITISNKINFLGLRNILNITPH